VFSPKVSKKIGAICNQKADVYSMRMPFVTHKFFAYPIKKNTALEIEGKAEIFILTDKQKRMRSQFNLPNL
jgi:hypothetical protein